MDWPCGQQEEPHRGTGRAQALLPRLVVKQMWVTKSRMGGNGVLQEFNAETHAFRLPTVMPRDKGSLFLGYPGAVLLIWAELVWVISSAGGNQPCSCGSDVQLKTAQKWWLTGQCVTLWSWLFAHWLVLCKRPKSSLVYTGLSVWGNLWSGWELCIFHWANIRQEKSVFAVPLCFAFAGCLMLGEHGCSHSDRSIHTQLCALAGAISISAVMSPSTMDLHPAPFLGIHRSASPDVCCANLHQPGCGVQNESCCWCSPRTCFQRTHMKSALLPAIGKLFSVLCIKMKLEQHTSCLGLGPLFTGLAAERSIFLS